MLKDIVRCVKLLGIKRTIEMVVLVPVVYYPELFRNYKKFGVRNFSNEEYSNMMAHITEIVAGLYGNDILASLPFKNKIDYVNARLV